MLSPPPGGRSRDGAPRIGGAAHVRSRLESERITAMAKKVEKKVQKLINKLSRFSNAGGKGKKGKKI
jgi:hypothetical protein